MTALVVPSSSGRPVTADAVVVIPGVMGSELRDSDSGTVRWGLTPKLLASAWLGGNLAGLHVTEEDRSGGGRLRPTRLLREPAYSPFLGGIEPYTPLLQRVAYTAVHQKAILEFPYDWRLAIDLNARKLVLACEEHLASWREIVRVQRYVDPASVRLIIVAHSMGGLIARYATEQLGLGAIMRKTINLGTPYYGAVKAVQLLTSGEGAPLPKKAARNLARTCPGLYDLMPRYRCLNQNGVSRRLVLADSGSLLIDEEMMAAAATRWDLLAVNSRQSLSSDVETSVLVGTYQPTLQSISVDNGKLSFLYDLDGIDKQGDSTVYREAGTPLAVTAFSLPQRHGALAKSSEALAFVADRMTDEEKGPPMGTRPVGADIPDLVEVGKPATVKVFGTGTGTRADPTGVSVRSVSLETGGTTLWRVAGSEAGGLLFTHLGLREGLHRIQVNAGGYSSVTDLLLATQPS